MLQTFTRNNITLMAIIIFLFIFGLTNIIQPGFLYNSDGSIRNFGVGYRNKTIVPIWLYSIILGILSYLLILYYISSSKIY